MKQDYPRIDLSHDKWTTDSWIQAIFPLEDETWFDPCPIDYHPNTHDDGLTLNWCAEVNKQMSVGAFVNPPYSDPLAWVKKAIQENKNGLTVVMLLKHDSSTEWYRLLHEAGARMMMINRRLKYGSSRGAAFPSLLVVLE